MTSSVIDRYEADIIEFNDAMMYKLKVHQSKGHWEDADLLEMLRRLREEVEELNEATLEGNSIEIMLEAADVANFALIIQWLARHKNGHTNSHADSVGETVAHSVGSPGGDASGASISGSDVGFSDSRDDEISGRAARWASNERSIT